MGYSSRYHIASLVAVFTALAIGILIGAALGSDVVSGTAENLEQDLAQDLDNLRAENQDLGESLEFERDFSEQIAPAVAANRLQGREIALVGLGNVETKVLTDDVRAALAPTGAELTEVAIVREPPDADALIDSLPAGRRSQGSDGELLSLAAMRAGRSLVGTGEALGDIRATLLSGSSGDPAGIDGVVVARSQPDDPSPRAEREIEQLEVGLIQGFRRAGVRAVGAERSDTDPSSIEFFGSQGLPTVDSIDQLHGKLALALALDGADGDFGVKETAESLLPQLIERRLEEDGGS